MSDASRQDASGPGDAPGLPVIAPASAPEGLVDDGGNHILARCAGAPELTAAININRFLRRLGVDVFSSPGDPATAPAEDLLGSHERMLTGLLRAGAR
jgi:hypothetical protein